MVLANFKNKPKQTFGSDNQVFGNHQGVRGFLAPTKYWDLTLLHNFQLFEKIMRAFLKAGSKI